MNNKDLKQISENIKYYADKQIKIDLDADFENELKKFPVCNKNMIKQQQIDFIDFGNNRDEFIKIIQDKKYVFDKEYKVGKKSIIAEYTSGTTGSPFVVLKTRGERLKLGKNLWNLRNNITKAEPDGLFDFIHSLPFKNVNFDPKRNRRIQELEYLSTSNYSWWHTTSRVLEGYKQLCIKNGFKFPSLKVIENNGSYISPEEKLEYEKMFDCKVVDNYGSRELWTIAYTGKCGNLHINTDNVFFELLDDDGNPIVDDFVPGNVTLTSKNLKLMPFIRYQIGDIAEYIPCDCDSCNRAIRLVPGRNYIKSTDLYGNKYFKDIVLTLALKFNLKKYDSITVVQDDYYHFRVNVVNNQEKREILEKVFVLVANDILGNSEYKFEFSYDDNETRKSVFTVVF